MPFYGCYRNHQLASYFAIRHTSAYQLKYADFSTGELISASNIGSLKINDWLGSSMAPLGGDADGQLGLAGDHLKAVHQRVFQALENIEAQQ